MSRPIFVDAIDGSTVAKWVRIIVEALQVLVRPAEVMRKFVDDSLADLDL